MTVSHNDLASLLFYHSEAEVFLDGAQPEVLIRRSLLEWVLCLVSFLPFVLNLEKYMRAVHCVKLLSSLRVACPCSRVTETKVQYLGLALSLLLVLSL